MNTDSPQPPRPSASTTSSAASGAASVAGSVAGSVVRPLNPLVRNAPLARPGFTQADQDTDLQHDRDAERRLLPATLLVLAVIALVALLNLLTQ